MLALLAAAILLPLGAAYCLRNGIGWPCPAQTLFGLPCPTCGGTRAFAALAELDVYSALRWNPLVVLGLFGGLLFPLFRRFCGERIRLRERVMWPLMFAAAGVNWVYLWFTLPR